jgi:hypothetical protein
MEPHLNFIELLDYLDGNFSNRWIGPIIFALSLILGRGTQRRRFKLNTLYLDNKNNICKLDRTTCGDSWGVRERSVLFCPSTPNRRCAGE